MSSNSHLDSKLRRSSALWTSGPLCIQMDGSSSRASCCLSVNPVFRQTYKFIEIRPETIVCYSIVSDTMNDFLFLHNDCQVSIIFLVAKTTEKQCTLRVHFLGNKGLKLLLSVKICIPFIRASCIVCLVCCSRNFKPQVSANDINETSTV